MIEYLPPPLVFLNSLLIGTLIIKEKISIKFAWAVLFAQAIIITGLYNGYM